MQLLRFKISITIINELKLVFPIKYHNHNNLNYAQFHWLAILESKLE